MRSKRERITRPSLPIVRRTIRNRARPGEHPFHVACVRPIAGERPLPLRHPMRWAGFDPERGVANLAEADASRTLGRAGRGLRFAPRARLRKAVLDGRCVNACWIDELCVHGSPRLDFARPARCERESENGSLHERHNRLGVQACCQPLGARDHVKGATCVRQAVPGTLCSATVLT